MKGSTPEYADVILPLAVSTLFTYKIPQNLQNQIDKGMRVLVPFGKKKLYTALVYSLHNNKPETYETKDIDSCLDSLPIVTANQFLLWEWIADYYMCSLGEVMKAALPSGLKLESETRIYYNETFSNVNLLSNAEELIMNILSQEKTCKIEEIQQITKNNRIQPIIESLLTKQAIFIGEEIIESYKIKTEPQILLQAPISDSHTLNLQLNDLASAPKQKQVFEYIISEFTELLNNHEFSLS